MCSLLCVVFSFVSCVLFCVLCSLLWVVFSFVCCVFFCVHWSLLCVVLCCVLCSLFVGCVLFCMLCSLYCYVFSFVCCDLFCVLWTLVYFVLFCVLCSRLCVVFSLWCGMRCSVRLLPVMCCAVIRYITLRFVLFCYLTLDSMRAYSNISKSLDERGHQSRIGKSWHSCKVQTVRRQKSVNKRIVQRNHYFIFSVMSPLRFENIVNSNGVIENCKKRYVKWIDIEHGLWKNNFQDKTDCSLCAFWNNTDIYNNYRNNNTIWKQILL